MLTRLALLAALALPFQAAPDPKPQHAQKPPKETVSLPEGGARVPFRFDGNQVRLDAQVNGKGPVCLVLDTGMPTGGLLLYRTERVQALGLQSHASPVIVAGAGGDGQRSAAEMAPGLAVTLGDLEIANTSALVVDPAPGFPPAIDGIVGGALFFHHVVTVDIDRSELRVRKPEGWSPPDTACVVPLALEHGKSFVDLRVAVGDGEPIPARVVVDIGAGHALSLNQADDGRFAPPAGAIEAQLGRGMSGVILGQVGRVRRVELGTFAFDGVVTSFPARKDGKPGSGEFRDGNLGEEVLRRLNATFDYEGGRLVLEKARGFAEPFEREMAGLAFDWERDGTATVRAVLKGSPAEAGGVQVGDRLLAVDGQPMARLGETGLRKALQVDGAELRLALRRGEATLELKVRLRRLV